MARRACGAGFPVIVLALLLAGCLRAECRPSGRVIADEYGLVRSDYGAMAGIKCEVGIDRR